MNPIFVKSFFDELSKIAQEFEPNDTLKDPPNYPFPDQDDERPEAEQIVEEGRAGSPKSDAGAGFAALDTRDRFGNMMDKIEGRQKLRQTYDYYRDNINQVVRSRKAFTRGLLRSRRQKFGPSPTPRRDLKSMLFSNEPEVFETSFAK